MSNILIIKHGSLGDIAQASGAIQDISENHSKDQIHLLTTKPYFELFKKNPFINNVILDKRLSRFNLIYLYLLARNLKNYNFKKVYDLQNSNRSSFYKRILFPSAEKDIWSSTETTLPTGTIKQDFDKDSVLERFDYQLKSSGLNTVHTMKPDFNWAVTNIDNLKQGFNLDKYIVLFPFCSPHLVLKKWPHYNELIDKIKDRYQDEYKIIVAPGPDEIREAKKINALCILDNGKSLDISQLSSIIKESSFVVANDTGPAHMASHLKVKGLTLFGFHTTAYKVSIENKNFKALQAPDLKKLSANKVFEKLIQNL